MRSLTSLTNNESTEAKRQFEDLMNENKEAYYTGTSSQYIPASRNSTQSLTKSMTVQEKQALLEKKRQYMLSNTIGNKKSIGLTLDLDKLTYGQSAISGDDHLLYNVSPNQSKVINSRTPKPGSNFKIYTLED